MRFKKKPNLYYKIAIPVYVVSIIVFGVLSHVLNGAVTEVISPLNLRIYRDTALIMFLVQSVLIIVPALRGIGFDVKKFNFKKDIYLTKYVLLYILFVLTFIITIYAVK